MPTPRDDDDFHNPTGVPRRKERDPFDNTGTVKDPEDPFSPTGDEETSDDDTPPSTKDVED